MHPSTIPEPIRTSYTSHEFPPFAYLAIYFFLQYITYNDFIREWKINEIHSELEGEKKTYLLFDLALQTQDHGC